MRVHRITCTHYGPKNSHESTEAFLIADDEEQVVAWVVRECYHGTWTDPAWASEEDLIDVSGGWWSENPDATARAVALGLTMTTEWGHEVRGRRGALLRFWRGDFEEPADLYYGVTLHGWKAGIEVTPDEVAVLVRLGVAKDIRG